MSSSEEDVIAALKAAVLVETGQALCQCLDPRDHYPYLRSKYVLSGDDEELIESQKVKREQVRKLIDILSKKGSKGFDELIISIIQGRTQIFLAEKLNKAFEEKEKRLRALKQWHVLGQSSEPVNMNNNSLGLNSLNLTGPMDSTSLISSLTTDKAIDSSMSIVSDLGVDTNKLPKPVLSHMKESFTSGEKFMNNKSCEHSFEEEGETGKTFDTSSVSSANESNI